MNARSGTAHILRTCTTVPQLCIQTSLAQSRAASALHEPTRRSEIEAGCSASGYAVGEPAHAMANRRWAGSPAEGGVHDVREPKQLGPGSCAVPSSNIQSAAQRHLF